MATNGASTTGRPSARFGSRPSRSLAVADRADAGDAGQLLVATGLANAADVGEIALRQLVPTHELAVGEHDAVVAGLGRPLQQRHGLVDVLIHQQVRGQIDPAVFQRRRVGLGNIHRRDQYRQDSRNVRRFRHGCAPMLFWKQPMSGRLPRGLPRMSSGGIEEGSAAWMAGLPGPKAA